MGLRPVYKMTGIVSVTTNIFFHDLLTFLGIHALKILRAAELLDTKMHLEKYRKLLSQFECDDGQWHREHDERKHIGFERLKFWLGMPNSYYSSEWP